MKCRHCNVWRAWNLSEMIEVWKSQVIWFCNLSVHPEHMNFSIRALLLDTTLKYCATLNQLGNVINTYCILLADSMRAGFCVELSRAASRARERVRQGGMSGQGSVSGGRGCPAHSPSGRASSLPPDTHSTVLLRTTCSPHVTGHSCQGPIHHLQSQTPWLVSS